MGRDQKIKVCHLISGDLWAGAEVQAFTMLKGLRQQPDLEIMAIVLNEGRLASRLREIGLNAKVIDESRLGFFGILRRAREHLQNLGVDIIHSHRRKENVLAGMLKRSGHAEHLVQTVHGAPEPFKGLKRLKEIIYVALNDYFTGRYFDYILPVSDDLRTSLGQRLRRGRLTTVHNAIDSAVLSPDHDVFEMKRSLGLTDNQPVIGTAGRMVPVKGFDIFLKAARVLLEQKPEAAFLLAGDGPLLPELKKLSLQLGIHNNVTFLGFRADMTEILSCFDILVVSSHHEGIPTVVLEAMALKKAVVATGVGGIMEIIEPDLSGVIVKPNNPGAIASACETILNDAGLKEKLGVAARKRVEEKFSAEKQVENVARIYRQMVGGRSGDGPDRG